MAVEPGTHLATQPGALTINPLEEADILALIVFNQPINELGTGQQVSLAARAQSLAAGAVASQLARSIGGALQLDTFEINVAPEWRANLGFGHDNGKRFFSVGVNYQDEAYWADVLFARAATPSFTQVNAAVGWRFAQNRVTFKVVAQNLTDERVQQHIFGDILERRIETHVIYTF